MSRGTFSSAAFAIASAACSGDDDASSDTTANSSTPSNPATQPASPSDAPTTEPPATQPTTTTPSTIESPFTYQATIQRTSHNIPHITADDFGSLGYGYGYAFAEDHLCSLADVVVQARSEAASFFGAGTDDMWLDQDLVYKALDLYERAAAEPEPQRRDTPPVAMQWQPEPPYREQPTIEYPPRSLWIIGISAAVIIGVAFNAVVDGLIKGIIDPLIAVLAPGDVKDLENALQPLTQIESSRQRLTGFEQGG